MFKDKQRVVRLIFGFSVLLLCVGRSVVVAQTTVPATAPASGLGALSCAVIVVDPTDGDPRVAISKQRAFEAAAAVNRRIADDTRFRRRADDQNSAMIPEKPLIAALNPAEIAARRYVAGLLGTDLVLAISPAISDASFANVAVWESRTGLRLAAAQIPLPDDARSNSDQIMTVLVRSIGKLTRTPRILVAVEHLSDSFPQVESQHLAGVYTRIVREIVNLRDDVIQLEQEEAAALSINTNEKTTPKPLIISGDCRFERNAEATTVEIALRSRSNAKQLAEKSATTQPSNAPTALFELLGAVLPNDNAPGGPVDWRPAAAKGLADRAAAARKIGNAGDAVDLYEASLLLGDDVETGFQFLSQLEEVIRRDPPNGFPRTRSKVEAAAAPYFRGLAYVAPLLAKTGGLTDQQRDRLFQFMSSPSWGVTGHPEEIPGDWQAALQESQQRQRDAMLDLARQRARGGFGDDHLPVMIAMRDLTEPQQWDLLTRMIGELQDFPNPAQRLQRYGSHGYTDNILNSPSGQQFLDAAMKLQSPEMQKAAAELKQKVPEFVAAAAQRQKEMDKIIHPPLPAPVVDPDAQLVLVTSGQGVNFLPVDQDSDVVWTNAKITISRDGSDQVPMISIQGNQRITAVSYDGQFLWATIFDFQKQRGQVVAIDTQSRKLWTIDESEGLPPVGNEFRVTGSASNVMCIVGAAPGKAIVCGLKRSTWIALLTIDPEKGIGIKPIHQTDTDLDLLNKDEWKKPGVPFDPTFMVVARSPEPGGRTRVLIGRTTRNGSVSSHPLMVDIKDLKVEVCQTPMPWAGAFYTEFNGELYWVQALPTEKPDEFVTQVYRWRDRTSDGQLIGQFPHYNTLYPSAAMMAGDRFYIVSDELWTAPTPAGPYEKWRVQLPPGRPVVSPKLFSSSRHGLLIAAQQNVFAIQRIERATTKPSTAPAR